MTYHQNQSDNDSPEIKQFTKLDIKESNKK